VTLHTKVRLGTPTFVAGYETTPWGAGGWTINVPASVQEGDLGFIIAGKDDGAAITATDPAGWTRVITDTPATNSNWRILTRVRQAGDPATIAFGAGITGTVVAFWYRNARLGSVGSRWVRSGSNNSVTCPLLERSVAGSVLLAIAGDRSIAATAGEKGYASVTGATFVRQYEGNPTLSAGVQICATFYAEIAPAGNPSDVVWTLNDSAGNAIGLQLELVPAEEWRTVSQPKLKLGGAWRNASVMYTKVGGAWRQTWPDNSGTPRIVAVEYMARSERVPGIPGSDHLRSYPAGAPRYRVVGDTTQIHTARVELKYTPASPKSPKEQIIAWDVTHDWGIYMVSWRVDASTVKYYYAGMTHAEAAAIALPKYATLLWSPRGGGWFAYMPVCFDASGVTVPMRDDAAGGLDAHSGYAPFPPGRSAIKTADSTPVSLVDDYTVANGYTDQEANNGYYGYSAPALTSLTIILRNSGGTVLSQWGPAAAPYASVSHVPGLGTGAAAMASRSVQRSQSDLYWPVEWQGLFDNIYNYDVRFGRIVPDGNTAGSAEWWVFDDKGNRIGDFKLALRKGITDTVEVHGANIRPDLIGTGIMKAIVQHGLVWLPTRFAAMDAPGIGAYGSGPGVREIPDSVRDTYNVVLNDWGWTKLEDAPNRSKSAAFYKVFDLRQKDRYLIYDTHVPMYNRFSELGLPSIEEVVQW
jgi:hypothetical protein